MGGYFGGEVTDFNLLQRLISVLPRRKKILPASSQRQEKIKVKKSKKEGIEIPPTRSRAGDLSVTRGFHYSRT